jgi:hypothetical protein
MPTDISQIPRDENGAVKGVFRLRHRDPGFNDGIAGVSFEHGVSHALPGDTLTRMVAGMGEDLDLEEIAPDEPTATAPVEEPSVPAPPPVAPPVLPPAPDQTEPDPLVAADSRQLDREALLSIAAARGIATDPRWTLRHLRQVIDATNGR